jgi:hypothetical protein
MWAVLSRMAALRVHLWYSNSWLSRASKSLCRPSHRISLRRSATSSLKAVLKSSTDKLWNLLWSHPCWLLGRNLHLFLSLSLSASRLAITGEITRKSGSTQSVLPVLRLLPRAPCDQVSMAPQIIGQYSRSWMNNSLLRRVIPSWKAKLGS